MSEGEKGSRSLRILLLERPKPARLGHSQTALLGLPVVERGRADPMASAHIRRRHPGFLLLLNPNDLLFAEPAAPHSVRLLRGGLYPESVTFQGRMSARTPSEPRAILMSEGEKRSTSSTSVAA